mmetsp:Transcript_20712/g.53064  ORF Transcript_20712/g.53064 Transcript_20712/m.53064 type:complete len:216 (+) Transcript_20712:894-1541(+)
MTAGTVVLRERGRGGVPPPTSSPFTVLHYKSAAARLVLRLACYASNASAQGRGLQCHRRAGRPYLRKDESKCHVAFVAVAKGEFPGSLLEFAANDYRTAAGNTCTACLREVVHRFVDVDTAALGDTVRHRALEGAVRALGGIAGKFLRSPSQPGGGHGLSNTPACWSEGPTRGALSSCSSASPHARGSAIFCRWGTSLCTLAAASSSHLHARRAR